VNGVLGQAGKVWIRAGKVILATAACIARCCNGGGGDRYKMYLHRYCTYPECENFLYVWSDEIAYGDVLWKDLYGAWVKIGGVCHEVWNTAIEGCEEWGPSCVESIRYGGPSADGPPLSGPDIDELCGPCCGQYGGNNDLCRRSSFWSCAEQEYKCYECGEEDDVYVRATNKITQELSSEYIANQDAIFADNPNYRSCWNNGLILDLRESIIFRVENRLSSPDANGCQGLEAVCRQGDYKWYQGQWHWWNFGNPPSCEWQTDEGGSEVCGDHSWRASRCGADINPFTGVENDFAALCSFSTSGYDQSGNFYTRSFQRYQDGRNMSITDAIVTYYMTVDRFDNPIPGLKEVREFTYVRQLSVTTPCDSNSQRRCEERWVCADGNRPAPQENVPELRSKRPRWKAPFPLPKLKGRPGRAIPRTSLPQSTGEMF